jgi:hypothetical protein
VSERKQAEQQESASERKGEPSELASDVSPHSGTVLPSPLLSKFFPLLGERGTQSLVYLHCHQVSFVKNPTPSLGSAAQPSGEVAKTPFSLPASQNLSQVLFHAAFLPPS